MKTPKVVLKGLVSGRVKLTPELLEILKKHRDEKTPVSTESPREKLATEPSPARRRHQRMIFASPLPGRWIQCSGLLMVCACLMLPMLARAAGTDSTFDQANRAYAEGKMSAAARAFQSVIASRGFSAPVLFNLANAQLRDGQVGPAILNYERARWLAPNDPDIAANLDFARRKAGLPAETSSRMQSVLGALSLSAWAGIAAAAVLLLASLPLIKRLYPAARLASHAGLVTASIVLLFALVGVSNRWSILDRAVITAPETAARVSPVTVVQPLFTLHAGEAVTVKKIHGAFALIINGQGHEGWVSRDAIVQVIPGKTPPRVPSAS